MDRAYSSFKFDFHSQKNEKNISGLISFGAENEKKLPGFISLIEKMKKNIPGWFLQPGK